MRKLSKFLLTLGLIIGLSGIANADQKCDEIRNAVYKGSHEAYQVYKMNKNKLWKHQFKNSITELEQLIRLIEMEMAANDCVKTPKYINSMNLYIEIGNDMIYTYNNWGN